MTASLQFTTREASIEFHNPIVTFDDNTVLELVCKTATITESIAQRFIVGEVTVIDDGAGSQIISGGETISFYFQTPLNDNQFYKNFTIINKTNDTLSTGSLRTYTLTFVSPEMLSQEGTLSNVFEGSVIDIIRSIFGNDIPLSDQTNKILLSDPPPPQQQKQVLVDPSSECTVLPSIIAPNVKIAQFIDQVLELSFDGDSFPFLLFENNKGINFRSLKSLFTPEPGYEPAKFTFSTLPEQNSYTSTETPQQTTFLTAVQTTNLFDFLDWVSSSILNTEIHTFDLYNKQRQIIQQPQYDKFSVFNTNQYWTQRTRQIIEQGKTVQWIPLNSGQFEVYQKLAENIATIKANKQIAQSINVQAIKQNCSYMFLAGEIVELDIDRFVDQQDQIHPHVRLNGKFLTAEVIHSFNFDDKTYNPTISFIKFGYEESIENE